MAKNGFFGLGFAKSGIFELKMLAVLGEVDFLNYYKKKNNKGKTIPKINIKLTNQRDLKHLKAMIKPLTAIEIIPIAIIDEKT